MVLGADGRAKLTTDRMYRLGLIRVSGLAEEKRFITLPGGCDEVVIDLAEQVKVTLSDASEAMMTLTITNQSAAEASGNVRLNTAGICLEQTDFAYDLQPGASAVLPVRSKAADPVWLIAYQNKMLLSSFENK